MEEKSVAIKQDMVQIMEIGNKVNQTPPDFEVNDTEGNAVRLKDYIDSKKPVVVYFLATWCPYCAQDFTQLSKVYANYSNVEIIAISMDLSETKHTLRDYKSRFPQLNDLHFAQGNEKILVDYEVKKTTTKYAIKDGVIVYSGSGVFNEKNWKILLGALSK